MTKITTKKRILSLFLTLVMISCLMWTGGKVQAEGEPSCNEIELSLKSFSGGNYYVTGIITEGKDAGKTLYEAYGSDWDYGFPISIDIEFENGVSEAQNVVLKSVASSANPNNMYMAVGGGSQTIAAIKKIAIRAGGTLEFNGNLQKTPIRIVDDLIIQKDGNTWEAVKEKRNELELSLKSFSAGNYYVTGIIKKGEDAGKTLYEAYGSDWDNGFPLSIDIEFENGAREAQNVVLKSVASSANPNNMYMAVGGGSQTIAAIKKITIQAGGALAFNGSTQKTPIKIANDLIIQKNNDVWEVFDPTAPMVYNDIKMSFTSVTMSNHTLAVEVDLVAGPAFDAGKKITDVYGHWGPAIMGDLTYTDATGDHTVNKAWYSFNNSAGEPTMIFQHLTDTTTKITLKKGTIFTANNQTSMRLTNDLVLVKHESGTWGEEDSVDTTIYNDIKMNFSSVTISTKTLAVKVDLVAGPAFDEGKKMTDVYGHWGPAIMGDLTYTDATGEHTVNKAWYSYNRGTEKEPTMIFQHLTDTTTKITLKKGTIFTADNQTSMRLTNDLVLVKHESGIWGEEGSFEDIKYNDVKVDFSSVTDGNNEKTWLALKTTLVSGPAYDAGKTTTDVYGNWSGDAIYGNVTYTDETGTYTKNVLWFSYVASADGAPSLIWQEAPQAVSRITLKKGTIFTCAGKEPMRLANDLDLMKHELGFWGIAEEISTMKWNDVKISFDSFNGKGFYLNFDIVSGPDKGKSIADMFGEWGAGVSATITLLRDGKKETVPATWSVATGKKIYIDGNWNQSLDQITQVSFEEGTILSFTKDGKRMNPMRIKNTLSMEKEPVYGFWGLTGEIKTPTKFNDAKIVEVVRYTGKSMVLKLELVNQKDTELRGVYGNHKGLYGALTIGDPEKGVYTNQYISYKINAANIEVGTINVGLMDSIELKAGTVLNTTAGTLTDVPLRIVNSVKLTRDAQDDWIVTLGGQTVTSSGSQTPVSPSTGDNVTLVWYVIALVVTSTVAVTAVTTRRKRENQKN